MAIAFDFASESHTGATGSASEASFTWSHNPVATPSGILVFVWAGSDTNPVTSVTYDGVTVPEVSGGEANSGGTAEPGNVKAFFLGSGIPATDPADVVVNRTNDATEMWACAISVTSGAASAVHTAGIVLLSGLGTYAVQSVTDGSPGTDSVRFAGGHSGGANLLTPGTGSTAVHNFDTGAFTMTVVRETTAGQGARNVGFSFGTSEDRAAVHLAVKEVAVTNAAAEVATGTGAASGASESVVGSSSSASGTGTSFNAAVAIVLAAALSLGSGAATNSTTSLGPSPATASASGAAGTASLAISVNAESATATGAAADATGGASASPIAEVAAAIGTASSPIAAIVVNANSATGTGSSAVSSPHVFVNAGGGSGTGIAYDPTIPPEGGTNVSAGVATGAGSSHVLSAIVAVSSIAADGSSSAFVVDGTITVDAHLATANGTAGDAVIETPVLIAHRVRMNSGTLPTLRTGTPPSRIRSPQRSPR